MTKATHNSLTCSRRVLAKRTLYSLEAEAELEESDRRLGHEYVPMDVYVDPSTLNQHFRVSSLRAG